MKTRRSRKSTVKIDQERLWTPVRRGDTYCSPACGANCTVREHQQAVRDADRLVRLLRGEGWRPVVWENLGWHFRAESGPVKVYGDRRGRGGRLRYTCLVADNLEPDAGGSALWTTQDRSFDDPNAAVAHELRAAVAATSRACSTLREAARAAGCSITWDGGDARVVREKS